MNHHPNYIVTMRTLAGRIRDVPKFSVWQFDMLCDWCAYFWNKGTISFVIEEGEAKGVCMIKLFSRLEQFLEPFVHEPGGQFAMIESLAGDGPETFALLLKDLTGRWGHPPIVLWDRGLRTESGTPRIFTWQGFEKLARRFTHGLFP